jgi:hypothetical protein
MEEGGNLEGERKRHKEEGRESRWEKGGKEGENRDKLVGNRRGKLTIQRKAEDRGRGKQRQECD